MSKNSRQHKQIQELTSEVLSLKRELEAVKFRLKKRWEGDEMVKHELVTGNMGIWFCGRCDLILPDSMLTEVCGGSCPGIDGRFRSLCKDCIIQAPEEKKCRKCPARLCEICWDEQNGVCDVCSGDEIEDDGEAGEEEE